MPLATLAAGLLALGLSLPALSLRGADDVRFVRTHARSLTGTTGDRDNDEEHSEGAEDDDVEHRASR